MPIRQVIRVLVRRDVFSDATQTFVHQHFEVRLPHVVIRLERSARDCDQFVQGVPQTKGKRPFAST